MKISKISISYALMAYFFNFTSAEAMAFDVSHGKEIWVSQCVNCHAAEKNGPTAASHFAKIQWEKFIINNKHKVIDKKPTLSSQEKEELLAFLKNHAADSDAPEIAGLR